MTQPERGFLAQRLEETTAELLAEKEKSRSLFERLQEAETVIRFYSNPRNYKAVRSVADPSIVLQSQLEGDNSNSDNDPNTKIAGTKARNYLKRYED